jgi:hypothetical protein
VKQAAGANAHLVKARVRDRFDVLPLPVASDADALQIAPRRLRPNILIGGAEIGDERTWVGHALRIGDAIIGIYTPRLRCIVTTIDPDTGSQDLDVLRRIRHARDGALGLDCWTIRPGVISVGDQVDLVPLPTLPRIQRQVHGQPASSAGRITFHPARPHPPHLPQLLPATRALGADRPAISRRPMTARIDTSTGRRRSGFRSAAYRRVSRSVAVQDSTAARRSSRLEGVTP